jgi:uncharacterized protein YndB with AHSA1/START domain
VAGIGAPELFYVIYIAATPEQVWRALTEPQFTRQYFRGRGFDTDWQAGSGWKLVKADGGVDEYGEILEALPPGSLRMTWRGVGTEEYCEVRITIEPTRDGQVKLSVWESHLEGATEEFKDGGRYTWPMVLSGLKNVVERGIS